MTKLELSIPIDDEVWQEAIALAKTKWLQKYLQSALSPRQKYSKEKSQLVDDYIERIIDFNNQPHRLHDDKWLITVQGNRIKRIEEKMGK